MIVNIFSSLKHTQEISVQKYNHNIIHIVDKPVLYFGKWTLCIRSARNDSFVSAEFIIFEKW